MSSPVPWKILGRYVGIVSGGWDVIDDNSFILFGFRPGPGVGLPQGDIVVDFETGRVTVCDEDNKEGISVDIVVALRDIPPAN